MKRTLLFIACVLASLTMPAQDELTVEDIQNSGCLWETRGEEGEPVPALVLQKEGNILSVQLLNYESNCATADFIVTHTVSGGSDGKPCSVSISVVPVVHYEANCTCPFNISYTVHGLEKNNFYFACWWFEGLVELNEGEPLVLEYNAENVVIDGLKFTLLKTTHQAMPLYPDPLDGESQILRIPSELEYESEKYTVSSISKYFSGPNITKIILPKTIKDTEFCSVEGISSNPFSYCMSLETIEVDEENPTICSVDGILFNKDKTTLIGYPRASSRESYIVPEGVATIGQSAFYSSKNLKIVVLSDCVETLNQSSFQDSKSLEEVILSPNIKELPTYLFAECNKLKSVVIPEGVTTIGMYAFLYCSSLESVSLPASVVMVDWAAFQVCTSLKDFYCHATTVPNTYKATFIGTNLSQVILHVPAASISAYQAVEPWKNFKEIVALEEQMAYRPMIEDGKVWKLGDSEFGSGASGNPVWRVEYYYFDGDTIINGKTCKQMMCQRYISPNHPDYDNYSQLPFLSYVGAWYEEDQKVYVSKTTSNQFSLWYDFSIEANDTLWIDGLYPYVLGPRLTGGINGFKGVYRDVMMCPEGESIYNTTWLEGIGSIDGPIYNVYYGSEAHLLFLISCTVGDEVIYFNDDYEDGATPEGARRRFDFTHTIKTQPQAPRRTMGTQASLSDRSRRFPASGSPIAGDLARVPAEPEQSLYGEYNDLQLGINLDPLDDAYMVRITDETGTAVYEKTVNAASIVGLNIDISAYAEGRYTVTVENSLEIFTGEFVVQTTGIGDTLRRNDNGEITNDNIYNLQGQRISTLQKGLNIVNGQKLFVK